MILENGVVTKIENHFSITFRVEYNIKNLLNNTTDRVAYLKKFGIIPEHNPETHHCFLTLSLDNFLAIGGTINSQGKADLQVDKWFGIEYVFNSFLSNFYSLKIKELGYIPDIQLDPIIPNLIQDYNKTENLRKANDERQEEERSNRQKETDKKRTENEITEKENKNKKEQEIKNWIEQFGSEQLKKAVILNLLDKSLGAYEDERLAHDAPGWVWNYNEDHLKEIRNPSLASLQALEKAQLSFPEAELKYLQNKKCPVIFAEPDYLEHPILLYLKHSEEED